MYITHFYIRLLFKLVYGYNHFRRFLSFQKKLSWFETYTVSCFWFGRIV